MLVKTLWITVLVTNLLGDFTAFAYVEPDWWPLIESTFIGVNLKRCIKRDGIIKSSAPPDGQTCSNVPRTCFFGDQECNGAPYPMTSCFCDGSTWVCEPEACPGGTLTTTTVGPQITITVLPQTTTNFESQIPNPVTLATVATTTTTTTTNVASLVTTLIPNTN